VWPDKQLETAASNIIPTNRVRAVPVRVGHTGYSRILDGVSRCGELFDLTDCTALAVWEVQGVSVSSGTGSLG